LKLIWNPAKYTVLLTFSLSILTFIWLWRPFWKICPHRFTHHQEFCRQPDFDTSVVKVHEKSCLPKSPGGDGGVGRPGNYNVYILTNIV
jgi:hypothetical protein